MLHYIPILAPDMTSASSPPKPCTSLASSTKHTIMASYFHRKRSIKDAKQTRFSLTSANETCYKCGISYLSSRSLNSHISRCRATKLDHSNVMTFTQSEIAAATASGGPHALNNNCRVGEAYNNQLLHPPTLSDFRRRYKRGRRQPQTHIGTSAIGDCQLDSFEMEHDVTFDFDPMMEEAPADDSDVTDATVVTDGTATDTLAVQATLPVKYRNKMRRNTEMKRKVPTDGQCPEHFRYNNTMNQQATAYAELLKICSKHGVSKSMYDDIVQWAQHHTQQDSNTFQQKCKSQNWTRQKTIRHTSEVFGFENLKPTLKMVELHDCRKVTVPVIDFKESMRSILDDKTVMSYIMKGLNPHTWRPTTNAEQHEGDHTAMLTDKVDGYLYRQGIELHCPDETKCDPTQVRPFPVIFHIDKSHSDLFGNLAVAPVQCMPAMLDSTIQQYSSAWRQIATIPNLSAGKGKDGRKNRDSYKKLVDFHKVCMFVIVIMPLLRCITHLFVVGIECCIVILPRML